MVAWGDGHRGGDPAQGGGQGLGGLPVGLPGVQQIAGEKDQVGPPLDGGVGQPVQQLPLFPPALPGLLRRQSGKGGVQVEVGGMEDM